jgi:hypothetical protein
MGFSSDATDLTLRLFDGSIHAFKATEPNLMQVTDFSVNNILVKDVSNRLDLESSDGVRGDREMSTCEMMDVVWEADYETQLSDQRRATALQKDLRALMGLEPPPPLASPPAPRPKGYCRVFRRVGGWLKSQTVGEDSSTQAAAPGRQHGTQTGQRPASGHLAEDRISAAGASGFHSATANPADSVGRNIGRAGRRSYFVTSSRPV